MSRIVVIAGTDTGVGKTFVTAALARALVRAGRSVLAVKPVETGCLEDPSETEDGVVLARATGQAEPRAALVRLRAPLTPALAADREGASIDVGALGDRIAAMAQTVDLTLVEGAGGLLSPISWEHDLRDLARNLNAPVLVVGADRLGTLNHVRMTVEALASSGLSPLGIVLSVTNTDQSTGTNAAALARGLLAHGDLARRVVVVPHAGPDSAEAFSRVVSWLLPMPETAREKTA
jgi:dethiobiotin synthase